MNVIYHITDQLLTMKSSLTPFKLVSVSVRHEVKHYHRFLLFLWASTMCTHALGVTW